MAAKLMFCYTMVLTYFVSVSFGDNCQYATGTWTGLNQHPSPFGGWCIIQDIVFVVEDYSNGDGSLLSITR